MKGIFVTGTDTGIGKTTFCAALLHRYRASAALRYWKPVQTGWPEDDDTQTVRALGRCAQQEICSEGIRLPRPLSPHLSARLHGVTIQMEAILRPAQHASEERAWIVEGAGGVLVPLNAEQAMLDLMLALQLPVLVVARSSLGTINHTLLTLEALRARSLRVAGVGMVGEPNPENRRAIEHYGRVPVLCEMPHFSSLTAETLGAWAQSELDPQNTLAAWLEQVVRA
jgi:dethiobiotin synthase